MDETLVRQLTRQLKILNLWITFFGTLFLISLIIIGILIFKLVSFTQHTADKITDLQQKTTQTLNVQKKLCDTKSVGSLLQREAHVCN